MSISLFPGEEVIAKSNDDTIILTDMRLIVNQKSHLMYFFLEDIKSIKTFRFGDLRYLFLAMGVVFLLEQFLLDVSDGRIFISIQLVSWLPLILFWWL